MNDVVNHPSHYCHGGIETIDYMRAKLTDEQYIGYLKGNLIKYVSRAGLKHDEVEDIEKAQWYLNRLLDVLKTKEEALKEIPF
jgi:hypothetical protein